MTFEARDGVKLSGRLFGSGPVAVVFSHMGRPGDTRADWTPVARALADREHLALVYNRRGVCSGSRDTCSGGTDDYAASWRDVAGAVDYAREQGAEAVVLVGASIGAMSSLYAATRSDVAVEGLIEVGGINHASGYDFTREEVARVEGPKLFVSSAGDVYGGADSAREWYRWATPPKRLVILSGDEHGTDLLRQGRQRRRLISLIVNFVERVG